MEDEKVIERINEPAGRARAPHGDTPSTVVSSRTLASSGFQRVLDGVVSDVDAVIDSECHRSSG
jgi:hypothetical protein